MTEYTNEQLESLISRSLDGELTASEQAEVDRLVLADPSARRLLEEYRRLCARAAAALTETLAAPTAAPGVSWLPAGGARGWLGPLSAVAAAALLAAGAWLAVRYLPGPGTAPSDKTPRIDRVAAVRGTSGPAGGACGRPADAAGAEGTPLMFDVPDPSPMFDRAHRGERFIDRQFFGGFDEARREFYMMELDRVRTRVDTISLDM